MSSSRRRCTKAALAFGALFVLAACGSDGGPSAPETSLGSIRGTVTDDSGASVASATIGLDGNGLAARSTTSGADGVYTFTGVAAGTYTLTITPPSGFVLGATSTSSVTVAGETQTDVSAFVLERVIVNGSVTGIVTDDAGAPVGNAVLALTGNGQVARSVNSGANGVYTFANVIAGAYTLAVTPPPGFTVGTPNAAAVTVASGAQTNAPGLVLDRMSPDEAFADVLDARLEQAVAALEFSGAVLVMRGDSTLFEGAYGLADREAGIPNSTVTRFRVGSMNKMLTAVSVLQLVQGGTVELDAPLITYLPDYPNVELASKVTIHHLLTHTGGTGDIFGPQFTANRLQLRETDDYLELYGTRALQFEPGEQWVYSNYGFMLLGAVVERVTGMSYDDYVAAHILAPAGMTSTGAAPEDSLVPGRSRGYMWSGGSLVSNAPTLPYRGTPAGGWYSTVRDFERFANALREHRLLDAAHTALLLDGKVTMGQSIVKYAYGFIDRIQVGRRLVGHGGAAAGMSGELSFEPAGGYTIVVLSNFSPPAATMIEAFTLGILPTD